MPKEEKEKTICSKDNVFLNVIKQKTVHTGGYGGARVRLRKGFSVSTGSAKGDSIKEKYIDKIGPGELLITSQKIVFMSLEKNVSIKAGDVIQCTPYYDGIQLADEKGTYFFTFDDDGGEFCNKFIAYASPGSPLLEPKPEEKKKTRKDMHLKDLKRYHRILLFMVFCFIMGIINSIK